MKKFLILSFFVLTMSYSIAEENSTNHNDKEKKVVYVYKQFEKFDFDALNIEGGSGNPSDLSISPIHEKRFTNHLPYRKSFTVEIKKGIERVQ